MERLAKEATIWSGGLEAGHQPDPEVAQGGSHPLFALFFVAVFIYVLREALFGFGEFEERAALFPLIIGVPSLVLALLVCGQELRRSFLQPASHALPSEVESDLEPALVRRCTVGIACWIVEFFCAIWLLGFTMAGGVATFLYLKVGAREKWPITLVLSFRAWIFFYGPFDYSLHLPFPEGELFLWLGW